MLNRSFPPPSLIIIDHLTMKVSYEHVPRTDPDESGSLEISSSPAEDDDGFWEEERRRQSPEPLEVEPHDDHTHYYGFVGRNTFGWRDPWLPALAVAVILVGPTLVASIVVLSRLFGTIWIACPLAFHLALSLTVSRFRIPTSEETTTTKTATIKKSAAAWTYCCGALLVSSIPSLFDVIVFGFVYPKIFRSLIEAFFIEGDGTNDVVLEWSTHYRMIVVLVCVGRIIACLRLLLGAITIAVRLYYRLCLRYNNNDFDNDPRRNPSLRTSCCYNTRMTGGCSSTVLSPTSKTRLRTKLRSCLTVATTLSAVVFVWSLASVAIHVLDWPAPEQESEHCSPLDTTECCYPFPSFRHLQRDTTTATGYRVAFSGNVLPLLKGKKEIDPSFVNDLDGFSTMGPVLFYIEGLREAHEQRGGMDPKLPRLFGPAEIEFSTTERSVTLLVDVASKRLIHHSAEVDYLDSDKPTIIAFPAQPLHHNHHYAMAVVNAHGSDGVRLSPTAGTKALLLGGDHRGKTEEEERKRYLEVLIPALEIAAPWFSFEADGESLQLLFDFRTISEESQLGNVRAVRDATLAAIGKWDWKDRMRLLHSSDNDCDRRGTVVARTISAELDVPWFLEGGYGGPRGAVLDESAAKSGLPTGIGSARFLVHVPCSLRDAAVASFDNKTIGGGKSLRAIIEYGHGLFGNRGESREKYVLRMANEKGYIITAMDWRGMSAYDLPVVIKAMISNPTVFRSTRDNLIQGYANKFALQHFSRNGLLSMDWMHFAKNRDGDDGAARQLSFSRIPTHNNLPPTRVFYGISQGGILGAGYVGLSAPTGLVERAVLTVPGMPWSFILTRSNDFRGYDALLLKIFYNNRHVRIFLALAQMCWDSVEGSGVLAAKPIELPPTLLQAGLGDSIVPFFAAENLARGMGARVLPHNPRQGVFGIPTTQPAANETGDNGPNVTLTELMYQEDYDNLPADDVFANDNAVHWCTRKDPGMVAQLEEFVNTGRVVDPCEEDDCFRSNSRCW